MRGSGLLWRRWRDRHEVTILGQSSALRGSTTASAFRPLRGGETLDGGVLEIDGELRVWPRRRESDHRRTWYEQRFLPTLDALTRLDVERVLVTHGEPVLRDGARALAASLARPPWRRSSLY
jgi:hypothetical protein